MATGGGRQARSIISTICPSRSMAGICSISSSPGTHGRLPRTAAPPARHTWGRPCAASSRAAANVPLSYASVIPGLSSNPARVVPHIAASVCARCCRTSPMLARRRIPSSRGIRLPGKASITSMACARTACWSCLTCRMPAPEVSRPCPTTVCRRRWCRKSSSNAAPTSPCPSTPACAMGALQRPASTARVMRRGDWRFHAARGFLVRLPARSHASSRHCPCRMSIPAASSAPAISCIAQADMLAYLQRIGVLLPDGSVGGNGLASAFVQLSWPWLHTQASNDLPESLESPDGVLAGLIAGSAAQRGIFPLRGR